MGAAQSVPLFGGHRGGRPRKDGLPAGSPEAIAADKAKHAERMRRARAREAAAQPTEPLPAILDAPDAPAPGVEGPSPAPAGGVGDLPPVGPVPWRPETLKPLCEQGLALWEEIEISQAAKALKAAGIPAQVVARVEKEGRFPELAKRGINTSAPPIVARLMNKTGISSEHQDSLILLASVAALVNHSKGFRADVRALIAEAAPKGQGSEGQAKPAP